MSTASRIYDFTDGQVLTAEQLDGEFNNLVNTVNAIDNDNIATGANISPVKISASIKGDAINRDTTTGSLSVKTDNVGVEVSGDNVQLKDLGVVTAKINTGAVTAVKIADGAVTPAKDTITSATIAALDIDWSTAKVFKKTITGNEIYTFSNTLDGQTIVVAITASGADRTATFPTAKWRGGVAATNVTSAKTNIYTFIRIGSDIFASVVDNMS